MLNSVPPQAKTLIQLRIWHGTACLLLLCQEETLLLLFFKEYCYLDTVLNWTSIL